VSYATRADIARGYVVVALPCTIVFDLFARYALRKWLHRVRSRGGCLRRVVVVGRAPVVASLTEELRRETHHGFSVVAACLAESADSPGLPIGAEIAGVPAVVGLDTVADVAERMGADTVAVLSCPEISGAQLRALAWELEKTGTDLCVAPALMDVAGPRTVIPELAGQPRPDLVLVNDDDLTYAKIRLDEHSLRTLIGADGRGHAGGVLSAP